jgi:protein TonB
MILPGKDSNAHLASAWTAGTALLFLGIGLQGAVRPLLPPPTLNQQSAPMVEEIMIEDFDPPAPALEGDTAEVVEKMADIEIPPLPEITAPITPPEMAEITPLEPDKPPPPAPKPPEIKPRPVAKAPPAPSKPRDTPTGTKTAGSTSGASEGAPTLFTGGGRGRFPAPSYPASARSAKLQGSVRLMVTVEASGLPGAVSVISSSGHTTLDNAARDTISRRWRWPSGSVRKYIVPIRFVLQ